jgi:exopolysaccharide biosynthesis WecB/TagA/CpsF family protein
MIDLGRRNILGVLINAVDYDRVIDAVVTAARASQKLTVSASAVHGVMMGALDPVHRYRLNQLDMVLPDGQPVRWALNWLYQVNLPDRVYGPKLTLQLCERAQSEGIPVYFYGSRPEVIAGIQRNLKAHYPHLMIAGAEPSCFRRISSHERDIILGRIKSSGARILFVGLGCPRQEIWLYENGPLLNIPQLAVGASFDYLAGAFPQAPPIMQRIGLEWLFRLLLEPGRLWRRYLILNPLFVWLLFQQKIGLQRFDPQQSRPPDEDVRHG